MENEWVNIFQNPQKFKHLYQMDYKTRELEKNEKILASILTINGASLNTMVRKITIPSQPNGSRI